MTHLQYFTYKHRIMPSNPEEPLFFTYGVSVGMTPAAKAIYEKETVMDKLRIYGQKKVDNFTEDDYVMDIQLNTPIIKSSNVVTSGPTSKSFHVNVVYSYESHVKLTKGNRVLINTCLSSPESTHSYPLRTFETAAKAREYWENNRDEIKNDLHKSLMDESIKAANRHISLNYGFYIDEHTTDQLKTITTKKHSEYEAMDEKVTGLKTKLTSLDGTTPLSEEELAEYIDYFKGLPERFTTDSKADKKMRYCGYYDLVEIYTLLDKPEEASKWAEKLIQNGVEPKQGVKLKERAEQMAEALSNSFFKTRQFTTDGYFVELQ